MKIVNTIELHPNDKLLDVACGPGTLLFKIYTLHPSLKLTGLDIDPEILEIARKKSKGQSGIQFIEASATQMPLKDKSFDVITSTLAFHHLTTQQKQDALSEICRLLKPGGTFWLFDFAKPT
ncbi:MAG: class I SAM-dependent methyltransferase, partial [Candidatus Peregrinibacteria bacterium]|nr:class I SAM-dependent methyltransferase [Candidatus Peregrinibacteria bacterium]